MEKFEIKRWKEKLKLKKIGAIGVDAGLVMIGDPSYSVGLEDTSSLKKDIYGNDWDEFCDKLKTSEYPLDLNSFAFCIRTVNGDGLYDIYGVYDDDTTTPKYLLVEL